MAYQSILQNYFGGDPTAYATEIKRKEAAGTAFSNPTEASAFKTAYPQLFSSAPATTGVTGTTGATTANNMNTGANIGFQPPSYSSLLPQAQTYASLQVNPQVSAVQRSIEQALQNYQQGQARVNAIYGGLPALLERREQQQAEQDLESAIARGVGRGGVVEHLAQQRQEHFGDLLAQGEAKRAAELQGLADQYGLTLQQADSMLQDLEAQRGMLTSQYMTDLDREHWQRMLDMLPWTQISPAQQHELNIGYAGATGKFQPMLNQYGGVGATQPIIPAQPSSNRYVEGGITYENIGGQIYKDGRLIPPENYRYIPVQVGGTRQ